MKLPLCRLCHHEHGLSSPHVFTKTYSGDEGARKRPHAEYIPPDVDVAAVIRSAERNIADRADKKKLKKALTTGLPKPEAKALKAVIAKIEAKSPNSPKRKEYLKLKAVERRAAVKAGLSVADYRKQQVKA